VVRILCYGGGGGNRTRANRSPCFLRALGRQGSQRWSLVTAGSLALILHLSRWFGAVTRGLPECYGLVRTPRPPLLDLDPRTTLLDALREHLYLTAAIDTMSAPRSQGAQALSVLYDEEPTWLDWALERMGHPPLSQLLALT